MMQRPPGTERTVNVFQNFAVEAKSPFDLERLSDKFRHRNTGWTIPEAILAVMVASAMSDGSFTQEEGDLIQKLALRSRALRSLSPADLAKANDVVNQRLAQNPNALKEACETLPSDMCLPFFAHCVDIMLADGELVKSEGEFLDRLATMLDLDQDHSRRVMEVLLLKALF